MYDHEIIWRSDDIAYLTKLDEFSAVHDIFNKYNVKHTIAIIAKDIEKNQALVDYIKSQPNIVCQLHCWEHIDYSQQDVETIREHLSKGKQALIDVFGVNPTIIFPPWNRISDKLVSIAKELGMKVSYMKISLAAYIRAGGGVGEDTVNWHYWHHPDVMQLDIALKIYSDRKFRCIDE